MFVQFYWHVTGRHWTSYKLITKSNWLELYLLKGPNKIAIVLNRIRNCVIFCEIFPRREGYFNAVEVQLRGAIPTS